MHTKTNAFFLRLLLTLLLFFSFSRIQAQSDTLLPYTDISKIEVADTISKKLSMTYLSADSSLEDNVAFLHFTKGIIHKTFIRPQIVNKRAIIKFNVCNSSDSESSAYLLPSFFFTEINLYKLTGNKLYKQPRILPNIQDSIGYRKIVLAPHDSATIIAELKFLKTYTNSIRPRLIRSSAIASYDLQVRQMDAEVNLMTYVFCGLLLMMVLYSITTYVQGANKEFLYYSGYAFFIGGMLFTKSFYTLEASYVSYFLEAYLDFIMQCISLIFYMIFMQRFLETKKNYPFLQKLYNVGIGILIAGIVSFSFYYFLSTDYIILNIIENITKNSLILLTIIFLIYVFGNKKDKLLSYLFWGNLMLMIFAIASVSVILIRPIAIHLTGIFHSSLFYYELGLLLELIFFLMGLSYKNRKQIIEQTKERERLKLENERKEFEKQMAVMGAQQDERNRISADMHDELGAGMTAIRLMSEIARNRMKEDAPKEIDKISQSANDLLNKMNAIIWSMNSGNDTLDNLVSYIRAYSLEYFDGTEINCRVKTPELIADQKLPGDKRRNIFLCVKETLNNALKHSQASEITINIETGNELEITISDNGIGVDLQNLRQFGNGLQNISRRMKSIGGVFKIETNNGTITTLTLPLA